MTNLIEDEIVDFKVHRAEAEYFSGKLIVRLYYPDKKEKITTRIPESLDFGISVFENLLTRGFASLTDNEHYFKPASGGSLYVLSDDAIICNRRDLGARTHPMYHSAYGGYPSSIEECMSAKGLFELSLRETAEECLLITKGKNPWLVVPNDSIDITLASAKRLGYDFSRRFIAVPIELIPARDTLEVYTEKGRKLFSLNACMNFIYESTTSLTAVQLRKIPFSSEEIVPIDGEFIQKGAEKIHLNRESYIVSKQELSNIHFGENLIHHQVFKMNKSDGVASVCTPLYKEPFFGPEKVSVSVPHIWAPDDMLVSCLDNLRMPPYKDKKIIIELEKTKVRKEGRSLVRKEFLK